ncbi:hypothetical protein STEG23_000334 [Scotinomys teguina]
MQGGCVHLDQCEVVCRLRLHCCHFKRGSIIWVVVTEGSSVVSVDKTSHSARILEDVPYLHIIQTPQKPANMMGVNCTEQRPLK